MSKLTLKTEGDTHVVVTRRFAAPPKNVYRAHTEPQLLQKWLLGPDGWTMPRPYRDASLRYMMHGPIQPMEEPGLLARLLGWR